MNESATIRWTVSPAEAGERLDRAIAHELRRRGHAVSNRDGRRLVSDGAARVDGRIVRRSSTRVAAGAQIEVAVAVEVDDEVRLTELEVLYRDEWIVAVNKPSGLPTHATHDPNRDHAVAAVQRTLRTDDADVPYVAVHHRLDVDTSGVLVFAIDRRANKGLADAFAQRRAKKTYIAYCTALADDEVGRSFAVEDFLRVDKRQRPSRSIVVTSGGDHAHTDFSIDAVGGSVTRVIARPRTGRMHQIRAHLSGLGRPILGDVLYGGSMAVGTRIIPRVMLHALRLELPHPVLDEELLLQAPPPDDMRALAEDLRLDSDALARAPTSGERQ